jgi:hypothetical protein
MLAIFGNLIFFYYFFLIIVCFSVLGVSVYASQIKNILDSTSVDGSYMIKMAGGVLPVRYSSAKVDSDILIVSFRGAVNRNKEDYPAFFPELLQLGGGFHHLMISDPSLSCSKDISLGWYIGYEGFVLQNLLSPFILEFVEALGINKTIYLGSSGGGFAALYYSNLHPGSAVLVMCPQTNLKNYYSRLDLYISKCWSSTGTVKNHFFENIATDLGGVYENKCSTNAIVYLQSYRDGHHMSHHLPSFLNALGSKAIENMILICDYWGVDGHSGSVPYWAWSKWLLAMICSDKLDTNSIFQMYLMLNKDYVKDKNKNKISIADKLKPTDSELLLADYLKNYHLKG